MDGMGWEFMSWTMYNTATHASIYHKSLDEDPRNIISDVPPPSPYYITIPFSGYSSNVKTTVQHHKHTIVQ